MGEARMTVYCIKQKSRGRLAVCGYCIIIRAAIFHSDALHHLLGFRIDGGTRKLFLKAPFHGLLAARSSQLIAT
jgi:hypothetical protein